MLGELKNHGKQDCSKTDKIAKANYIDAAYFLQAKDIDFSNKFDGGDSCILHIHGDSDISVPRESLNISFNNQIIVRNGDHDLEKPNQIDQRITKASSFILK